MRLAHWRDLVGLGLECPGLAIRAVRASRGARKLNAPGLEWGTFGRRLGWKLVRRGDRHGVSMLLTPVNIVRYWEFPFVASCLPSEPGRCLDVASPRLFGLFVATTFAGAAVTMINPDRRDADLTRRIIDKLGIPRVDVSIRTIEDLQDDTSHYDCAWAISVIEHIAGDDGDTDGLRAMYRALVPGGRLIATVPVDREFRIEYRDRDEYRLSPEEASEGKGFFFQRYYDETAIARRLFDGVGRAPSVVRWFGERQPGRFLEYERRWQRQGQRCTVEDPIEIARHYREFETWADMPGIGVCGFMIEKPTEPHDG